MRCCAFSKKANIRSKGKSGYGWWRNDSGINQQRLIERYRLY